MITRHKNRLVKPFLFLFVLFAVALSLYDWQLPSWWIFSTDGMILLRQSVFKEKLFIGNGSSSLKAINTRTGREIWSVQLTESADSPPQYYRGNVYTMTVDGVLYANNANDGKELWRYEASVGYVFETPPTITPSLIFIGDSRGVLHAVDRKTGKRAWVFTQQEVSGDSVDRPSRPNWFGQLLFYKNRIIIGGADGTIYVIHPKTGKVVWKYSLGSALSGLEANTDLIIATTKDGQTVGISTDGIKRWSVSGEKKVSYILYFNREHPLTIIGQMMPPFLVPGWAARLYLSVITVTKDGEIQSRDIRNGKTFYTVSHGSEVTTFPTAWSRFLFFGDSNNKLTKLDGLIGKDIWSYKIEDKISNRPFVEYRNFLMKPICQRWGQSYWISRFCLVTVFVGDDSGHLEAIRANSGNSIWKFRVSGPITSAPTVVGERLFFASQDGNVYRIALFNGKIKKSWLWNHVGLTQNTSTVSGNDIVELTLSYPDNAYPHPWKDIAVSVRFVHSSGKTITIDGYYYDKDTWKVKFNPTDKGEWKYTVFFSLPDETIQKRGQFVSNKTSKESYLHLYESNGVKRLSADGTSVFPIIGIGDVIDDANCNGNLLDDFFIGDGHTNPGLDIFNKHCLGKDTVTGDDYFSQYNGFNTFRWSVDNASFNLWKYTDPSQNTYRIFEGKMGDRLAETVTNHDFKLWMTLYSWNLPNESLLTASPAYMHMIKEYIRYVVARYGAYVSIWELNNEAHTSADVTDKLALYIKSLDYESRPITTSWEQPSLPSIDIISLHWYENEVLGTSDLRVLSAAQKFMQYDKTIVFSEQGNKNANWDEHSATRMRIRAWTAALNGIGIIFWNSSQSGKYVPPEYRNGNIYIGGEERSNIQALTSFLKNIGSDANSFSFQTDASVRSYGLSDKRVVIGYFHRFSDYLTKSSMYLSFYLPQNGTLTWYDTKNSAVLSTISLSAGYQALLSPPFQIDIAAKVTLKE
jgi:outer membrane protein assembly factor BamB